MKKINLLYETLFILGLMILIFFITSLFVSIKNFIPIVLILICITGCIGLYYIYYAKKVEVFNGHHDRFSHMHNDILFINIDDPFDIKKPYHFLSPKKAIEFDKKYAFSDDSKNYTIMSVINNKLYLFTKTDENNHLTTIYDLYNNKTLNHINQMHHDLLYGCHLLRLKDLKPTSNNENLNNIIKKIKEYNLTEKQLINHYLKFDKQLDLNDNEIKQYYQDYFIAYNELNILNELNNAKNYENFINNQNFEVDKSSQIYNDISDVINQLNKIKK